RQPDRDGDRGDLRAHHLRVRADHVPHQRAYRRDPPARTADVRTDDRGQTTDSLLCHPTSLIRALASGADSDLTGPPGLMVRSRVVADSASFGNYRGRRLEP